MTREESVRVYVLGCLVVYHRERSVRGKAAGQKIGDRWRVRLSPVTDCDVCDLHFRWSEKRALSPTGVRCWSERLFAANGNRSDQSHFAIEKPYQSMTFRPLSLMRGILDRMQTFPAVVRVVRF